MSDDFEIKTGFGIRARLILTVTLLTAIILIISLISSISFWKANQNFNTQITHQVNALVIAVNLNDQVHELTKLAPQMALSEDHTSLLELTLELMNKFKKLELLLADESFSELKGFVIELTDLSHQIKQLIKQLDLNIAQRIEVETSKQAIIVKFIRMFNELQVEQPQDVLRQSESFFHLNKMVSLFLSISTEDNPLLNRTRLSLVQTHFEQAKVYYQPNEKEKQQVWLSFFNYIENFIFGDFGYFLLQSRSEDLKLSIRQLLDKERKLSVGLNEASHALLEKINNSVRQGQFETKNYLLFSWYVIVVFFSFSIVVAILILAYIRFNFMRRMSLLKSNISNYFKYQYKPRIFSGDDELSLINKVFAELIERVDDREKLLTEQATLDPLTKVFNRRSFAEKANNEIKRASRNNEELTVLMLDIDFFKQVNDQHGHAIGDKALQLMAQLCQMQLRETDIFARFGGEEFVALLPETNLLNAKICAERIRDMVERVPLVVDELVLHMTVSIGVALINKAHLEDSLKSADEALYQAKEAGRNKVIVQN